MADVNTEAVLGLKLSILKAYEFDNTGFLVRFSQANFSLSDEDFVSKYNEEVNPREVANRLAEDARKKAQESAVSGASLSELEKLEETIREQKARISGVSLNGSSQNVTGSGG